MKILKVKCLAPTRLDNYLMQQYPALNPGRLNKALRENKIKLNGKKQPLSTRVMAGDEIKLFILDEVLDADKRVEGPAWKNARGPAQVIYDCPQILVVNKPAGLSVDGPEDDTLLNRALLYLNQQGEYKENESEPEVFPKPTLFLTLRSPKLGVTVTSTNGLISAPSGRNSPPSDFFGSGLAVMDFIFRSSIPMISTDSSPTIA